MLGVILSQNGSSVRIKFDRNLTAATGFFAINLPIPIWMLFLIVFHPSGVLVRAIICPFMGELLARVRSGNDKLN
jgi:hypothetical protein